MVVFCLTGLLLEACDAGMAGCHAWFQLLGVQLRDQVSLFHFRAFIGRKQDNAARHLRTHDHFVAVHDAGERDFLFPGRRKQVERERNHKNGPDNDECLAAVHRDLGPWRTTAWSRKSSTARFRAATAESVRRFRPTTWLR